MDRSVGKILVVLLGVLVSLALAGASLAADGEAADAIEISFERFVLDNGLTVIVHENHDVPIVGIQVWYRVGSKDEPPGKTGFAHLFEHLMFNGSENLDQDWFLALEEVGATSMNGTTSSDRTNYFQTVPSSALDRTLWMESDRMGHLLGAITQEKLDEQRGVVQNEKRQGENRPYGSAWTTLSRGSFPKGHPYSWPVIGSMEDLNAASLEDVHEWFRSYYGAANAVIALAGDIDVKTAREKMELFFGDIPAGPPLGRHASWIAKRQGEQRRVVMDRVPQSRIYKAWNTAPLGTPDAARLELAAQILGGDKNSRLYKRLVHGEQIATDVSSFYYGRELAGWFVVQVDAKPGLPLDDIERAIDEELAALLGKGPSKAEMERAQITLRAEFVRNLERVGGFGGKANILAAGEVHQGDPAAYRSWLSQIATASRKDVRAAANEWLSDGVYVLEFHPFAKYQHSAVGADRSELPALVGSDELSFPKLQRAQLDNGLRVILAERHALPLVEFELLIDAGYSADYGAKLGTSAFALGMLKEGTRKLDALEIADREARLGAVISTRSSLDTSSVRLSSLKENLAPSLELFSQIALDPAFDSQEIERKRALWLAKIMQEKSSPKSMALRTLPPLLYGEHHPYGIPFTGSGTEESIQSLTREDLVGFVESWMRPDAATLIAVGDITLEELLPMLEQNFGGWQAPGTPRQSKPLAHVETPPQARVYLIDRPGAEQSVIIAGQLAPRIDESDYDATQMMNRVLGGSFTSRLNMNLREDKHWSYGARSSLIDASGERPLFVMAPVQTDKTAESITEILKEFRDYLAERPATATEISRAKNNNIRKLPGRYETNRAVLDSLVQIVRFGWPDDHVATYGKRIEALQPPAIHAAAQQILLPERLTWVVVGDLELIEEPVRALDLGEVTILDADGKPVGESAGAQDEAGAP